MPPEHAETIDKFQILQFLGEGGMGRLYLGRDPDIGRLVAIKLLREGFDSEEFRERFNREAKSASALRHANIVTIFQTGTHQRQPFIVMEYIQGKTLADIIERKASISLDRKLHLMDELSAGLQYAHRKGVIHRDIKPANVMVDEEGVLRILDFGIARFGGAGLTQSGAIMGTLSYMAPEQLAGVPVDSRADIFSAGAVFYELLSHRRAFPGDFPAVLQQIVSNQPASLERLEPELDRDLIAVVNRCLTKRPEDRYPDFGPVREALATARRRIASASGESTILVPAVGPTGAALLRVRGEQIQRHIESARRALDDAAYSRALEASQSALVLDPECVEALDLENRARAAVQQQQLISRWVADAGTALDRGDATAASVLVDRALSLSSDSPEALAIRRAIDDARRQWADARAGQQPPARSDPRGPIEPVTTPNSVAVEAMQRQENSRRLARAGPRFGWQIAAIAAVAIIGGAAAVWRLPARSNVPRVPASAGAPGDAGALAARVASLRSTAREAWQRGELELALNNVGVALTLQPDDAETRGVIEDFVGQARERSTRAAADARSRQAESTAMYSAAQERENEGGRLQGVGRSAEAARAFADAADLFARASVEREKAPPAPSGSSPRPAPVVGRGDPSSAAGARIAELVNEADALRLRRDYDAAIARYLQVMGLDPQNDKARAGLGETRAAKQRAEDALSKLAGASPEPSRGAAPAEAEAQRLVGVALKAMDAGDDAAAQNVLEEALRLNPRNESAQKLLKVLTGR